MWYELHNTKAHFLCNQIASDGVNDGDNISNDDHDNSDYNEVGSKDSGDMCPIFRLPSDW